MKFLCFFSLFLFLNLTIDGYMPHSIDWLEKNSMLYQAEQLSKSFSGKKTQWQHPYASPEPKKVIETASVWLNIYPMATITENNESILSYYSNKELWKILEMVGIKAIHTGPMKIAGGIFLENTPSVDGGFDRIGLEIDPDLGNLEEYIRMTKVAKQYGGVIAGDLVPGHSGIGPDFLLALMNYKDYPGIFHIIEIDTCDWFELPHIQDKISKNLSIKTVQKLKKKGYISGELERVIFKAPGIKETNWSATPAIEGIDGKVRRWVYLHYFKSGEPTLNWLDPTFAANRMIAGDIIQSLTIMNDKILRLDANGFLGIEPIVNTKKAYSEGHPLSMIASDMISELIRKLGGYSFQELNLGLSTIKSFIQNGADLTYDFITRSAYINALIHENTDLLKIAYSSLKDFDLQPISFIHALQNHDEFNYELIHFKDHPNLEIIYHQDRFLSGDLRKYIQKQDFSLLNTDYNTICENGPCSTLIGLIASALKVTDIYNMSKEEKEKVKKAHLLLAFFNAMQPGVFTVSAWDLIGALPLKKPQVSKWTKDGDFRWVSRGAYDLMSCTSQKTSCKGLPKALSLYGPLPKQLKDPYSFLNKLKEIIKVRTTYHIDTAKFLCVIPSKTPSLLLLLNELPNTNYLELTAINFGSKKLLEKILIEGTQFTSAINLMKRSGVKKQFESNILNLELGPWEGKVIIFEPKKADNIY